MNVIDAVILLFLLWGAVLGFKKGVIKSVVSLVGTILVVVLSFYLKNPLSVFLYTYLPFFEFGIAAINILIYEAIAFLIVFSILMAVLKIVIKLSGLIETLLKFTVVLSIPSKILGAIFGFFEYYVFAFIILFILAQVNINSDLITSSKLADKILSNTPVMSNVCNDTYTVVKEIISLNKEYKTSNDKDKLNNEAIDLMLKYNLVSKENVVKLQNKKKFDFKGLNEIIEKYEVTNND